MSTAGLGPTGPERELPRCERCGRLAKYLGKFAVRVEGKMFASTHRWPVCGPCVPVLRDGDELLHGGVLAALEGLPDPDAKRGHKTRRRRPQTDTEHYRCQTCRHSQKGPPGKMFCDRCGGELDRIGSVTRSTKRRREL